MSLYEKYENGMKADAYDTRFVNFFIACSNVSDYIMSYPFIQGARFYRFVRRHSRRGR